jgi:hypothetical protein
MKKHFLVIAFFLFALAILGFRSPSLFAMTAKNDLTAQESMTPRENSAGEGVVLAKINMPSKCFKVTIDYSVVTSGTGNGQLDNILSAAGANMEGNMYFDAKDGQNGKFTLQAPAPSGEQKDVIQGDYTIDDKGNIKLSPIGLFDPGDWLSAIVSNASGAPNYNVTVVDGGLDPNVAPIKPPKVSFTNVKGQKVPTSISDISNVSFNYQNADINVNGLNFSNVSVQLNLDNIRFAQKKTVKCKKTGSLSIDSSIQSPNKDAIGGYCTASETGNIKFSLVSTTDLDNACEYTGEGQELYRQDCYMIDGCEYHMTCNIGAGIVGKVPDPFGPSCDGGSLVVDFAESWDCQEIVTCLGTKNQTFLGTYTEKFPYKNTTLDKPVAPSSGYYRFRLQLK